MPKEHRRYGQMNTRRAATRTRTYEVRVVRTYEEEWVDLEINATSAEEAQALAQKEAEANAAILFGTISDPSYSVTDCEPIEE